MGIESVLLTGGKQVINSGLMSYLSDLDLGITQEISEGVKDTNNRIRDRQDIKRDFSLVFLLNHLGKNERSGLYLLEKLPKHIKRNSKFIFIPNGVEDDYSRTVLIQQSLRHDAFHYLNPPAYIELELIMDSLYKPFPRPTQSRAYILLGASGSGKSASLNHIEMHVPAFVKLVKYADGSFGEDPSNTDIKPMRKLGRTVSAYEWPSAVGAKQAFNLTRLGHHLQNLYDVGISTGDVQVHKDMVKIINEMGYQTTTFLLYWPPKYDGVWEAVRKMEARKSDLRKMDTLKEKRHLLLEMEKRDMLLEMPDTETEINNLYKIENITGFDAIYEMENIIRMQRRLDLKNRHFPAVKEFQKQLDMAARRSAT